MKNLAAAFCILLSFPFVSGLSMASETVSCSDLVDQLIKGAQDSSYWGTLAGVYRETLSKENYEAFRVAIRNMEEQNHKESQIREQVLKNCLK